MAGNIKVIPLRKGSPRGDLLVLLAQARLGKVISDPTAWVQDRLQAMRYVIAHPGPFFASHGGGNCGIPGIDAMAIRNDCHHEIDLIFFKHGEAPANGLCVRLRACLTEADAYEAEILSVSTPEYFPQ